MGLWHGLSRDHGPLGLPVAGLLRRLARNWCLAWWRLTPWRPRVERVATESQSIGERPRSRSADARGDRRPQQAWPQGTALRILSLDGGGLKGIFAARLLGRLESDFVGSGQLHRYFDYIVGTSTGGIIGLGIAAGVPADHIERLYREHGKRIFPSRFGPIPRRYLQPIWHPYSHHALEDLLREAFADQLLAEVRTRVCVPACDGSLAETWIFKTPHHPDFKNDWRRPIAEIARATSAAPTYLRPLKVRGYAFLDGGLFANNPIMVAIADALSCYDVPRSQVEVLTIGTGGKRPILGGLQGALGGSAFWATKVADTMISFASQNALGQAMLLVGAENIVRIEPPAQLANLRMDDAEGAERLLPAAADDVFTSMSRQIHTRFLCSTVEPPNFYYGQAATRRD